MGDIFNQDFQDFIRAFNKYEVDYILVGGYAVIYHGYNRTTGDLDLYVNPSKKNYRKIEAAFFEFGLSTFDMTLESFIDTDRYEVFSFGNPPVSIDLITSLKGVSFKKAKEISILGDIDGILVRVLHFNGLLYAKKKSGRPKDKEDIYRLQSQEE